MVTPALLRLYDDLRRIRFGEQSKPSERENYADLLEVLAVHRGLKPAHLQGHGLRDEGVIEELEQLAGKHGLLSMRSKPHIVFQIRKPKVPDEYLAWEVERDRIRREAAEDVLWVFRDAKLAEKITALSDGKISEAELLGYPRCCVEYHSELGIRMGEMLVQGYRDMYGAQSAQDLIRCSEEDRPVRLSAPIELTDDESAEQFPFTQVVACQACLNRSDSLAAQLNGIMKRLAFAVDQGLHNRILRCAAKEKEWREHQQRMEAHAARKKRLGDSGG